MNLLRRIDRIWEEIEHAILSFTVILMSAMLIGNAVSRYFLNKSWAFTEEIGKVGVIVITFMGIGYAARKSMHIEMSGFFDLMSKRWQKYVSILISSVTAIILALITYFGIKYVMHLYNLGQVSTILRYPLYITMMVIPIGFFLGTIRYLIDFIQVIVNKTEN